MDHQWRQMPPPPPPPQPQGNSICPMCSISHFPFCPPYPPPPHYHHHPPPPFQQSPMFPPPPPDPYHAAPPGPHFPNPNDAWQLHRSPNFGFPQQPVYNNNNNYYGNGYIGSEYDRSYKRARVEEVGSGVGSVFGHETSSPEPGRLPFSPDNERRLKLIRDHGHTTTTGNVTVNNNYYKENSNGSDNLYSPFQPSNSQPNHQPHQPLHNGYLLRHEGMVFGGGQPLAPPPPLPPHQPPPLPVSPPPPVPMEPPVHHSASPPNAAFPLFPVPIKPSLPHVSAGSVSEQSTSQAFVAKQLSPEKPAVINGTRLFRHPNRATRPEHIVIILRGLPGSGKSYLARLLRDLEVENGCDAPRIHSMDDYFMTEVEKVEENDKSSSSARGKKRSVKKVMEYCYEPEMEEAYRESMLKAFKKTLEDGNFKIVIVDDRNLRVADFAQFWALAKRLGYEVYISEATYKDPVGCAARNVHGFTLDEIQKMAGQWEEAPALYLQLDIKSLFHGDDLKESGILEVDMDMEDGDVGDRPSGQQEGEPEKSIVPPVEDDAHVASKDGQRWNDEEDHPTGVKDLCKSKWSSDFDEEDVDRLKGQKATNKLTGVIHIHGKRRKSVHWSDQAANTGFSIGMAKKGNMMSLVIGPGAGYNWKSNPSPGDENPMSIRGFVKSRGHSTFQERLRAERESFKAVFDRRRRQRIGGLDVDAE
ncbi:hypothetical protein Tsubulata_032453 [Turnera subulata]|uniref:YLP motif-containing protein 1 n=1 Tax=Turnera subulata TaxID=218843 RepID=A0A9Q0J3D5_9ROSI|nr:hypothetical protein Tsubulata_032453 [Turnera subulata]